MFGSSKYQYELDDKNARKTSETITRLQAELAAVTAERDEAVKKMEAVWIQVCRDVFPDGDAMLKASIDVYKNSLKACIAERDALKADAERYRYLRDDGDGFDISVLEEDEHGASWVHGYPPEELDAAIDAAMLPKGE